MRSKFAHQYLQQEEELEEQEHQHHSQRNKFLPMLCSSLSTKQVVIKLTHQGKRHHRCSSTSSTTSSTVSDEPLSPRVGCMGQVKRNNKVVGFPASSINTTAIKNDQIVGKKDTSNSIVKYYKLKRFFSSKSLIESPTTTIAATTTTAITRNGTHKGKVKSGVPFINKGARPNTVRQDHHHHHHSIKSRSKIDENYAGNVTASNNIKNGNEVKGSLVNLMELDPPLPVVKQLQGNNKGDSVSLWKRRSGGAPLKSLHIQAIPQSCKLLVQATTVSV